MDSYIHRSGRTGRAGKLGKCITLINPFLKSDEQMIERIKTEANINFEAYKIEN